MAIVAVIIVVTGFAPSFYLRIWKGRPPLSAIATAHAIVFMVWVFLFLAQTSLVAVGRVGLHRKLGMATAALGFLMVVSAPPTAIGAAARGELPGNDPLAFLLVVLMDIVMFAAFLGAGLHQRRRPEVHKRLMLLAMASLLGPAISRWPMAVGRPFVITAVLVLFVAAMPLHDLYSRRRVHPVSLWGGLALLVSGPLRFAMAQSTPWHAVAAWLIR